jgi:hypothetical protein
LKHFIGLAHERGILVMCDEIMCGLGRHGRGSCFLSTDLGLHIDAVTFGKAMPPVSSRYRAWPSVQARRSCAMAARACSTCTRMLAAPSWPLWPVQRFCGCCRASSAM